MTGVIAIMAGCCLVAVPLVWHALEQEHSTRALLTLVEELRADRLAVEGMRSRIIEQHEANTRLLKKICLNQASTTAERAFCEDQ